MRVLHHSTEENLADYLAENDPAFKTRIEEAFDQYLALGGITTGAMTKKLRRRLPHILLLTSNW
jgi:hypothetical protein